MRNKGKQIISLAEEIRRIKEKYADLPPMFLPPASDEEIKRHSRLLTGYCLPPIPQGYAEFLKICNGYGFDCVELYGMESVTEEGSSFTLEDNICSMTLDMSKYYEEYCERSGSSLLWFGRDVCGDYFTYDDKTGKYQRRAHDNIGHVYFECGTFEEFFDEMIYKRI